MRDLFEVIRGIPPPREANAFYAEQTRFNSISCHRWSSDGSAARNLQWAC